MIYTLISLLVFFWIVGLIANIGGPIVHTLLVLALIVWLFDIVSGRTTTV